MTQRIYLAGPMTGLPEHNFPAFHAEAARLRGLGYQVENPAEHGEIPGFEWADCALAEVLHRPACQTCCCGGLPQPQAGPPAVRPEATQAGAPGPAGTGEGR